MKYIETLRIASRHDLSLAEFLAEHDQVKRQAENLKPLDWLAGELVAEADINESFEDWIARQVEAILNTTLLSDKMNGTTHIARKVSSAKLNAEDKAYLVEVLGRNRDVMDLWTSLVKLPDELQAAA